MAYTSIIPVHRLDNALDYTMDEEKCSRSPVESSLERAVDEALKCKETGEEKTILFGLTGTGYFDLAAYMSYNEGTMTDYIPTDEDLKRGFAGIPSLPGIQ